VPQASRPLPPAANGSQGLLSQDFTHWPIEFIVHTAFGHRGNNSTVTVRIPIFGKPKKISVHSKGALKRPSMRTNRI
jgi:hypothetical protein